MSPITRKRALKVAGYGGFFVSSFLLMLYITFPFRVIADLAQDEARKANVGLSIGSIGPSLFGVKATDIALTPPKQDGAADPQPIRVDEIKIRPTLFPPGVAYEARLFGGGVSGSYGLFGKRPSIVVRAKGLDLGRTNAKAAMGVDLAGLLSADADLVLDADGTKITGKVGLNGEGLILLGGTVAQYDLPKVELGHVELALKVGDGKASVELFKSQGADVESNLEGEIQLAKKVLLSPLRLKLKFKPEDDFLKRNSFIQTGLSFAMSKDPKGFYTVSINRVLGNPGFTPQR